MATQAQLALNSFGHWCCQLNATATLYGSIAVLTVGVGVLGVVPASSALQMPGWRSAIHMSFGLLLCALVYARYRWCIKQSAPTTADDIGGLSRHLSRIVYLLLYVVVGVRLIVSVASSIWHGAVIDLDPFKNLSAAGGTSGPQADFEQLLVAGLLCRGFVYVLAHNAWRQLLLKVKPSKASAGAHVRRVSK